MQEIIPDVRPDEWRSDSRWNMSSMGTVSLVGMGLFFGFWAVVFVLIIAGV